MKLLLVFLAGVAVTLAYDYSWKKPYFCGKSQCPMYDVLERTEMYERREYHAGLWVSTSSSSVGFNKQNSKDMFRKLFRYISGANKGGEKLKMTAPVLTKVFPGTAPDFRSNFTMSFYVQPDKHSIAPTVEPTEQGVTLEFLPSWTVYVKSFGGHAKFGNYLQKAVELGVAIEDEEKFRTDFWMYAGYDSPWRRHNRHNEVWLASREDELEDSEEYEY